MEIEVNVIQWNKDRSSREVALVLHDFDQMLTLSPEAARTLAFRLVECSDFIEPPFGTPPPPKTIASVSPTSESFYGTYDELDSGEIEEEDDI